MTNELYILLAGGFVIVILFAWLIMLQVKLHRLLRGKEQNLDEAIGNLRSDVNNLKNYSEKSTAQFQTINKKLAKTISGNETVRFNPFKGDGSGSNQSFATALVNSEGDGVVISSLYSRDRVSVFSKPVKNMKSEYELTAEEKDVLQKAKESIK